MAAPDRHFRGAVALSDSPKTVRLCGQAVVRSRSGLSPVSRRSMSVSSSAASSSRKTRSGQDCPRSHLETACGVTPMRRATSPCVSPRARRIDAMRRPSRSRSIIQRRVSPCSGNTDSVVPSYSGTGRIECVPARDNGLSGAAVIAAGPEQDETPPASRLCSRKADEAGCLCLICRFPFVGIRRPCRNSAEKRTRTRLSVVIMRLRGKAPPERCVTDHAPKRTDQPRQPVRRGSEHPKFTELIIKNSASFQLVFSPVCGRYHPALPDCAYSIPYLSRYVNKPVVVLCFFVFSKINRYPLTNPLICDIVIL